MKRNWLSLVVIVAVALSVWGGLPVQRANAANPGDVLIVEVGADPASAAGIAEPAGEFIEIYNNTSSPIDLSGWTITDNNPTTITLPSITLGAGKVLVIIASTASFGATNGYGCSATPLNHAPAAWFANQLSNSADRLILRDNSNVLIDQVSYGADVTAFNPAATDVFNNSGATLQRTAYNTAFVDTNTNADWVASTGAGSPCDVSPTAVTLSDLSAASTASPAPIAFGLMGVAAAALLLRRKLTRASTQN